MGSKICTNCKKEKPFSEFYKLNKRCLSSWCKECQKLLNKTPIRKKYNKLLNRTPMRRKYNNDWRRNHEYDRHGFPRIRRNAKQRVWMAVKSGRLEKKPCEVCGKLKVDGHHEDYNKPLEFIWLCPTHHRERHQAFIDYMKGGV